MTPERDIDGLLVHWGDRLFYPGNRSTGSRTPKLQAGGHQVRAAALRERIAATVTRRAPQVMVKVTGGGRGMRAIAAHLRYISKNGRLDIEDERGEVSRGKPSIGLLAEEWRWAGTPIGDETHRREAFNLMLSMPRGTDPLAVQRAAREFARTELADHKYVMVLHDHQAHPHVHVSVRAESIHGKRLNPRKQDLQRWREVFAERLRGWGIEAEASRQFVRGVGRESASLWRVKASEEGRLRKAGAQRPAPFRSVTVLGAWQGVADALSQSRSAADLSLARRVLAYMESDPLAAREKGPGSWSQHQPQFGARGR